MSQPPQDDGTPADRTREVRLPPVPPRSPVPDQPTDRMSGTPLGQRDPTLRMDGGAQQPGAAPPATGGQPAVPNPAWARPGQPQGWGAPGQAGPSWGAPGPYGPPGGHGGPGYGGPGYGGPGYGGSGYGGPGYGGPGYGAPPPQQRRRRGPLVALLVALAVVLVGAGVLVTVLLTREDRGDTAITAPPSTSASASPTSASPTTATPTSSSPGGGGGFGGGAGNPDGGGSSDTLNLPESPEFAAGWVQSLVDGDAGAAYADLCTDGQDRFADPAALQGDFEAFLGGRITEGSATDAVAQDDVDQVTFDVTLETGAARSFVVTVVEEAGRPAVCGFTEP
ncbi:hypothetical protein SAMN05660464_4166 [Geodermatophilus dictyosporus]|uniref:DUF3887 domain-containing protein n=1 Tax=Geodermatophilus dictyosporus TaxID=1523247 RepID=A0A1I5T0R3_9ACTN|nr:hypothetical protein [Geodermatophilus dictyosporus]SFP76625.1 hypothetical protein SAMN05660464_4166 [Geodermatophilus dictyosporus]